jgi:hypothetical protein
MKTVLIHQAMLLSQQIGEHYWYGDIDFAEPYLDDGIDWVGASKDSHITGKEKLLSWLRDTTKNNPPVVLMDQTYHLVENFSDGCAVYGTYIGTTNSSDGHLMRGRQRVTMVWKMHRDVGLKCSHAHLSDPVDLIEPGDLFPFKISRKSWDFVQRQISTGKKVNRISVKTTEGDIQLISLYDLICLEAKGRYTLIHATQGVCTVNQYLSEMEAKICGEDPEFLRIGRSYIVNLDYVQTLSGDQMKLTDGITVPVPERILPEIRKALLEELI